MAGKVKVVEIAGSARINLLAYYTTVPTVQYRGWLQGFRSVTKSGPVFASRVPISLLLSTIEPLSITKLLVWFNFFHSVFSALNSTAMA